MNRVSRNTLLILSLTAMPAAAWWSPVWYITDGVRDANWYLKQLREEIFQRDRIISLTKLIEQASYLADELNLRENKYASANIRATTTAKSETHNPAAEERFQPIDKKAMVCSILQPRKSKSTCHDIVVERKRSVQIIQEKLTHDKTARPEFIKKAQKHMDDPKKYIRAIYSTIEAGSAAISQNELIEVDVAEQGHDLLEAIFLSDVKVISVEEALAVDEPVGTDEYEKLFLSNLYMSFIKNSLNNRTLINDEARYRKLLDVTQASKESETIAEINALVSYSEAIRIFGLETAKKLLVDYELLKQQLNSTSEKALKIKARR